MFYLNFNHFVGIISLNFFLSTYRTFYRLTLSLKYLYDRTRSHPALFLSHSCFHRHVFVFVSTKPLSFVSADGQCQLTTKLCRFSPLWVARLSCTIYYQPTVLQLAATKEALWVIDKKKKWPSEAARDIHTYIHTTQ